LDIGPHKVKGRPKAALLFILPIRPVSDRLLSPGQVCAPIGFEVVVARLFDAGFQVAVLRRPAAAGLVVLVRLFLTHFHFEVLIALDLRHEVRMIFRIDLGRLTVDEASAAHVDDLAIAFRRMIGHGCLAHGVLQLTTARRTTRQRAVCSLAGDEAGQIQIERAGNRRR
jgi:hypothetical protein